MWLKNVLFYAETVSISQLSVRESMPKTKWSFYCEFQTANGKFELLNNCGKYEYKGLPKLQ